MRWLPYGLPLVRPCRTNSPNNPPLSSTRSRSELRMPVNYVMSSALVTMRNRRPTTPPSPLSCLRATHSNFQQRPPPAPR